MASYLYRAAQPSILAAFLPWGSSTGAGRIRLAAAKIHSIYPKTKLLMDFLDWVQAACNKPISCCISAALSCS